mmetsp:Transcript_23324/g.47610  ORF Transcript_23324/g.47610 Transcript_23324/m.47610 type:complete len:450 (+) Transcript_23324:133-1482(+)
MHEVFGPPSHSLTLVVGCFLTDSPPPFNDEFRPIPNSPIISLSCQSQHLVFTKPKNQNQNHDALLPPLRPGSRHPRPNHHRRPRRLPIRHHRRPRLRSLRLRIGRHPPMHLRHLRHPPVGQHPLQNHRRLVRRRRQPILHRLGDVHLQRHRRRRNALAPHRRVGRREELRRSHHEGRQARLRSHQDGVRPRRRRRHRRANQRQRRHDGRRHHLLLCHGRDLRSVRGHRRLRSRERLRRRHSHGGHSSLEGRLRHGRLRDHRGGIRLLRRGSLGDRIVHGSLRRSRRSRRQGHRSSDRHGRARPGGSRGHDRRGGRRREQLRHHRRPRGGGTGSHSFHAHDSSVLRRAARSRRIGLRGGNGLARIRVHDSHDVRTGASQVGSVARSGVAGGRGEDSVLRQRSFGEEGCAASCANGSRGERSRRRRSRIGRSCRCRGVCSFLNDDRRMILG